MRKVCGLILPGVAVSLAAGCMQPSTQVDLLATVSGIPIIPHGVESRSISWENKTGAKGSGGQAGQGRKGSPAIGDIKNGQTVTLMDIDGTGVIRHIWMTVSDRSPEALRNIILRMYWDGSAIPSVEVPLGDFFGTAHGRAVDMASAFTTTPRGRGFNSFFPMPFATHAKITATNDLPDGKALRALFFQIDYDLCERLPSQVGYFHARFHRQNPTVIKQDYLILDHVQGPGYFLGCVLGVRSLQSGWWGEGEIKFYIDGDADYPTICGTGSEDYLCTGYGMGLYQTPWHGCTLNYTNKTNFKNPLVSMYRFHDKDPIYFQKDLKVTIQQLGYNQRGIYERSDDWSSVAFWYQARPTTYLAPFPDRAARIADLIEEPPASAK